MRIWLIAVMLLMRRIELVQAQPATQPSSQPTSITASRDHRDALIARARQRMRQDAQNYTPEQLKECEDLYQVANKNWRTDEAKTSLKVMIERYPDVNRTGCAALYLTQYERDPGERERLLTEVIEKYGDCWYGNGAQVGALARFDLGVDVLQSGETKRAQELFDEIDRDFAGAITHRGELLSERIKQIKSEAAKGERPGR